MFPPEVKTSEMLIMCSPWSCETEITRSCTRLSDDRSVSCVVFDLGARAVVPGCAESLPPEPVVVCTVNLVFPGVGSGECRRISVPGLRDSGKEQQSPLDVLPSRHPAQPPQQIIEVRLLKDPAGLAFPAGFRFIFGRFFRHVSMRCGLLASDAILFRL